MNTTDKEMLTKTLKEIIASGYHVNINKSPTIENALEYGIVGLKMKRIVFTEINQSDFWDFVYDSILSIVPNIKIDFVNLDSCYENYVIAIMEINERVKLLIKNRNHELDNFFNKLTNTKCLKRTYKGERLRES